VNFFTKLKADPHHTELKGKTHRLSHANGLFEASFQLSPADREEFERRAKLIDDELRAKLDDTGATYDATIAQARKTAAAATNEAHATAKAAKWALFSDYFKLPTPEQIAVAETPAGSVVRVPPPAPSTALPQGA